MLFNFQRTLIDGVVSTLFRTKTTAVCAQYFLASMGDGLLPVDAAMNVGGNNALMLE